MRRARFRLVHAVMAWFMLASPYAMAQRFPGKPIRFIVPYGVGGNGDLVARVLSQRLSESLGVQVVVDNRPGAGGNVGGEAGARAAPDGHTLTLGTNTHASNMSLYRKSPYDLIRDFTPVSFLGSTPVMLAVTPGLPVKSVQELITLAKSQPGKLNYASGGIGSSAHLATELFKATAGVDLLHITYKGAGGGLTEVVGGQIHLMFSSLTSLLPHVNSGRLRGIAVASLSRVPLVPQLPTIAESGLPGFEAALWNAILVPTGTPEPIIALLNNEFDRLVRTPDVADQLRRQGFAVATKSRPELTAYIREEIAKWRMVVEKSGARAE